MKRKTIRKLQKRFDIRITKKMASEIGKMAAIIKASVFAAAEWLDRYNFDGNGFNG